MDKPKDPARIAAGKKAAATRARNKANPMRASMPRNINEAKPPNNAERAAFRGRQKWIKDTVRKNANVMRALKRKAAFTGTVSPLTLYVASGTVYDGLQPRPVRVPKWPRRYALNPFHPRSVVFA